MKTYILGDHHSNYDDLLRAAMRKGLEGIRIIHVGDGMEGYPEYWDEKTVERLDNAFASMDIEYLTIRGNHSNPHVFDGSVNLPNFKLLPDYTRMEINGEVWLLVGGAVSINRSDRIEGQTWWPEEEMVLREELAAKADVLVTHAGPSWLQPDRGTGRLDHLISAEAMSGWGYPGRNLQTDLDDEQARHDRLFELVRPRQWYFGHYHHSALHHLRGCEIRQLDCGEFIPHSPPTVPQ